MFVIEAENLTKRYRRRFKFFNAIQNLTLSVKEGEVFGFLGPNGAGKSTTMKILVGLVFPTSGSVKVFGINPADSMARKNIGFLPENPQLYKHLTAEEFLLFIASLCGLEGREAKERIKHLLQILDMQSVKDVRLDTFSKGMIQRIGIAQAIIHKPRLVILDEPMSGLDPYGRQIVKELILQLKEEGASIFFSSHVLGDVESVCDRMTIIKDGQIIKCGSKDELAFSCSESYEVRFTNKKLEAISDLIKGVKAIKVNGNITARVDSDKELWELMEMIRDRKGKILSVRPAENGLERYFQTAHFDDLQYKGDVS